jgi:hypothetical protein
MALLFMHAAQQYRHNCQDKCCAFELAGFLSRMLKHHIDVFTYVHSGAFGGASVGAAGAAAVDVADHAEVSPALPESTNTAAWSSSSDDQEIWMICEMETFSGFGRLCL